MAKGKSSAWYKNGKLVFIAVVALLLWLIFILIEKVAQAVVDFMEPAIQWLAGDAAPVSKAKVKNAVGMIVTLAAVIVIALVASPLVAVASGVVLILGFGWWANRNNKKAEAQMNARAEEDEGTLGYPKGSL